MRMIGWYYLLVSLIGIAHGKFNISSSDVATTIVNGKLTDISQVPWQVGLRSRNQMYVFCGGSIIDKYWVLTAAHCFRVPNNDSTEWLLPDPADLTIVVGANNLKKSPGIIEAPVVKFVIHPHYDTERKPYDIALVRTNVDLTKGNQFVTPRAIKLATARDIKLGRPGLVSGYGLLHYRGEPQYDLYSTAVKLVTDSICQQMYEYDYNPNMMICASDTGSRISGGPCLGDSGGPLVVDKGWFGGKVLAGLISYGYRCEPRVPGVFTKVSNYVNWINAVMAVN